MQSVVGGNLSPYPRYEGDNLLVPGTGVNGASHLTLSVTLVTLCIVTIFL